MFRDLFKGRKRSAISVAMEHRKHIYTKQDKQYMTIISIRNKGEVYEGQLEAEIAKFNEYGDKIKALNEIILDMANEDGEKTSIILQLLVRNDNEVLRNQITKGGRG